MKKPELAAYSVVCERLRVDPGDAVSRSTLGGSRY
jgi:FMN phosphatase YigB (HAD superfamily)